MDRLILAVLLQCISDSLQYPEKAEADRVTNLPDMHFSPSHSMFSGYLDGSDDGNIQMYYWFEESLRDPSKDPLLVYVASGPGTSRLRPNFKVSSEGISEQDEALLMNREANYLTLDAPMNVGFSYSKNGSAWLNDKVTADRTFRALQSFFEKFPEYANSSFYVEGGSYGGVFGPFLVQKILQENDSMKRNLRGYIVTSGSLMSVFCPSIDYTSLEYLYTHGMISRQDFKKFRHECCNGDDRLYSTECQSDSTPSEACKQYCFNWEMLPDKLLLNSYHILLDCYDTKGHGSCSPPHEATEYWNRLEVKKALHVNLNITWQKYNSDEFGLNYPRTKSMRDIVNFNMDNGVPCFMIACDMESAVPYNQYVEFLTNLRKWDKPPSEFKPWYTKENQLGGFKRQYDPLMYYLIMRGAGHVAKRREADYYSLVNNIISGQFSSEIREVTRI